MDRSWGAGPGSAGPSHWLSGKMASHLPGKLRCEYSDFRGTAAFGGPPTTSEETCRQGTLRGFGSQRCSPSCASAGRKTCPGKSSPPSTAASSRSGGGYAENEDSRPPDTSAPNAAESGGASSRASRFALRSSPSSKPASSSRTSSRHSIAAGRSTGEPLTSTPMAPRTTRAPIPLRPVTTPNPPASNRTSKSVFSVASSDTERTSALRQPDPAHSPIQPARGVERWALKRSGPKPMREPPLARRARCDRGAPQARHHAYVRRRREPPRPRACGPGCKGGAKPSDGRSTFPVSRR